MFAKLIAAITENPKLIDFATGNLMFGGSLLVLVAVGLWVILKRNQNHKM